MKKSLGDKIFNVVNITFLILVGLIMIFPFYYVVIRSILPYEYAVKSQIVLFPKAVTFSSYTQMFGYNGMGRAFLLTVAVTVISSVLHVLLSLMMAYGFSKKDMPGGKIIFGMLIVTMYFGGGLIPSYLLNKALGLINNPLIYIIGGVLGAYDIILALAFIRSLPLEIEEAATVDGATYVGVFFKIILPMSMPIIATLGLFFAVGKWNDWFTAMVYMNDKKWWTLGLVIRDILINNNVNKNGTEMTRDLLTSESMKMATIVISTVPIIIVYPFLQKYFTKGMLIGAVKC
ncbi:MAG: carbohydrate ABC transporter permease [Clostridiales bacterium]|nr:carbohydrate ABC transporter permease [Clostridiales bacterium]